MGASLHRSTVVQASWEIRGILSQISVLKNNELCMSVHVLGEDCEVLMSDDAWQ